MAEIQKGKNAEILASFRPASFEAKVSSDADMDNHEKQILNAANVGLFYSFVNSRLISRRSMPPLCHNGVFYEQSEDKANLCQAQFSSVFTNDDGNLPDFPLQTNRTLESVEITEPIVLKFLKNCQIKNLVVLMVFQLCCLKN